LNAAGSELAARKLSSGERVGLQKQRSAAGQAAASAAGASATRRESLATTPMEFD
jgi:hypothetical protein